MSSSTVKIDNEFNYDRSIIILQLNDQRSDLQKWFFVICRGSGSAHSPNEFKVNLVLYGVKGNYFNIDQCIYDYEKAYEISEDERFKLYMPIDFNGFDSKNYISWLYEKYDTTENYFS